MADHTLHIVTRFRDATLLAMFFTIDRQQSFTCKTAIAIPAQQGAIREIARVLDQYIAYMFRAKQQHSRILP